MGSTAAKQLIEQIEHPKTTFARTEIIGGALVRGGSVGALGI